LATTATSIRAQSTLRKHIALMQVLLASQKLKKQNISLAIKDDNQEASQEEEQNCLSYPNRINEVKNVGG